MKRIFYTFQISFIVIFALSVVGSSMQAQSFTNPLQIPPLIESDRTDYSLNIIDTVHNFNPTGNDSLNTLIRTFAFEDADNPGTTSILGPSIEWQYENIVTPTVTNKLDERTTTHWHGAHVPAFADGGPHQLIMPGESWKPKFEVLDKSATMWYHPHAMDLTYEHVQMGLSGMIYVEDPVGKDSLLTAIHNLLPTEYGVNDFPLIVQTKKFIRNEDNELEIMEDFGFKSGYTYLVNGRKDPVLEVPQEMVRFRVLNGDGKFSFNLGIGDRDSLDAEGFQMIATDAGYMDRSYAKDEIVMSPGERTEWLVDFSQYEIGDTLFIYNKVSEMPNFLVGSIEKTEGYAEDRPLLKIVISDNDAPQSSISSFPIDLHPLENPSMDLVSRERTKTFRFDKFMIDGEMKRVFNIDSTLMDMMFINDTVMVDSTELWTIHNTTGLGHPFHIHDIHFWVTEVLDSNGVAIDKSQRPEIFNGPKDNVLVEPGWKLSFITTFSDHGTEIRFDSSYMYHCHILPHEDKGMMGQFVVWNGKTSTASEQPEYNEQPISLYPNPARDYVFLEGSSKKKSYIFMYSTSGKLIHSQSVSPFDGRTKLSLPANYSGTVFLKWLKEKSYSNGKLIMR